MDNHLRTHEVIQTLGYVVVTVARTNDAGVGVELWAQRMTYNNYL